ncbi:MAG: hypothetical protein ABI361_06340 [Nitrososphaera sp.]
MTEIDFLTDKMIDIAIASSLGIFIMVLHRRADKRVHDMIVSLHDYVTVEHREVMQKVQEMLEAEKQIDNEVHRIISEQQALIKELHEGAKKN